MQPLILAAAVAIATASGALWVEGRRPIYLRFFAGLVSISVTLILFSVMVWTATEIVAVAPPIWAFLGVLATLFAQRLYRELCTPPPIEPR